MTQHKPLTDDDLAEFQSAAQSCTWAADPEVVLSLVAEVERLRADAVSLRADTAKMEEAWRFEFKRADQAESERDKARKERSENRDFLLGAADAAEQRVTELLTQCNQQAEAITEAARLLGQLGEAMWVRYPTFAHQIQAFIAQHQPTADSPPEPCSSTCSRHVSHPCEQCGRQWGARAAPPTGAPACDCPADFTEIAGKRRCEGCGQTWVVRPPTEAAQQGEQNA